MSIAIAAASVAHHIAFRIVATARVVGAMNTARRDGTFELIAVTPIREPRISQQLLQGFRVELYFGLIAIALLDLGLLAYAETSLPSDRYLFPVWGLILGDWVLVAIETEGALPRCVSMGAMGKPFTAALRSAITSSLIWPWTLFAVSLPIAAPVAIVAVGSLLFAFVPQGAVEAWHMEGPGLAFIGAIAWRWLIGAFYAAANYYLARPHIRDHFRDLIAEGSSSPPPPQSLSEAAARNATLRYR